MRNTYASGAPAHRSTTLAPIHAAKQQADRTGNAVWYITPFGVGVRVPVSASVFTFPNSGDAEEWAVAEGLTLEGLEAVR